MQLSVNGNCPVAASVPTRPIRQRQAYTCDTCGCVASLQSAPDCCQLCGGWLARIRPEQSEPDCAASAGAIVDGGMRPRATLPPGIGTTLAIFGVGAVLWFAMAGLPDGMAECQRQHSFSTCASALLR